MTSHPILPPSETLAYSADTSYRKNAQGILTSKTTEILWPEKEETAARNNRNVNLRKLRVLLESIGDMEVMIENNFLRIKWGTNVFAITTHYLHVPNNSNK
ncbi:hypothetical protein SFC43_10175 [Bacteroides sp. CR5/BHMF/2]|nr:hypothetical protein [Bacteroides sp. CR5/BHMF/2]